MSEESAEGAGKHEVMPAEVSTVPCPYVYAKGRVCRGYVIRVEAYKADLSWERGADGTWTFDFGEPRSHYHLFCSEKGNHAGFERPDAVKRFFSQLPEELKSVVSTT